MRYQRCYTVMYILLVIISILAPETYGVTLKYGFIPLVMMTVSGFVGRRIRLKRVRIKPYALISALWIALVVVSTFFSEIIEWSANARSLCILILFFALLYEMVPSEKYMDMVKHAYIYLTLFCAVWIILQSFTGINRYRFMFIWGQKDVNYMASFMLPGVYMAIRFLLFEKQRQKTVYVLCIAGTFYSLLLVQSRAAFVTLIIIACLAFIEYMLKTQLSLKKYFFFVFAVMAAMIIGLQVWNNSAFSRLTEVESYKDNIRFIIWRYALQAFIDSPIIGSGVGASSYLSEIVTNYQTHCNYIDILGDTGILGMFLFILLSIYILRVKKGERVHMFSFFVACMLPLGFINGLQTISFWLPMLLLAHEHILIERRLLNDWNNHPTS